MNFTKKYFTPYGLFNDQTLEEFCATIPEFYFREQVPKDVIENFEVVKELLAHSYYAYKFIDEAYLKALLTFEMAVRFKADEFKINKKKFDLNGTIHKLYRLGIFETEIDYLKYVQMIRNHFAHPERHSFGGSAYWYQIESISFLINEMYEDVSLRKKRKKLFEQFIARQTEEKLYRFLVLENGAEKNILFTMELLFINNKFDLPRYTLACTPLFNLDLLSETTINTPHCHKIVVTDPNFSQNKLVVYDAKSVKPIAFSIIDGSLQEEFNKWHSMYEKHKMKIFFEHALRINYPDIIRASEREFQKM